MINFKPNILNLIVKQNTEYRMTYYNSGVPETNRIQAGPPWNATNFTSANPVIFNQLKANASSSPIYPLPQGSDARQIYEYRQNVSYFNSMNKQALDIKTFNQSIGPSSYIPYPQFKSHKELLMYKQGLLLTAQRNRITGENPSLPAGGQVSTMYQIINS
jgi:hypothetical protein